MLVACHPQGGAPSRARHGGEERCEAPEALPGSLEIPAELRARIRAATIPAEAQLAKRRVCNRMVLEPSAFAREHALDAIDWRPWSPAVLDEATALDRPLLVLSGFAACSTCDDLSRAELSSRRLAHDINRHFVPVLVDRDERPDVDAFLMQTVEVLTGGAGWPAAVFVLGDGRPFEAWSGGAAAVGRKKLDRIVQEVGRRLMLGGGTIGERGELTIEKMQKRLAVDTSGTIPPEEAVVATLRGYLAKLFDAATGSFGAPPLFPRATALEFLLGPDPGHADAASVAIATTALTRLRESPLADPAGGFHRYAREPGWKEPVREKMLADNAALASVYLQAAASTDSSELRDAARSLLNFLVSDLELDGGGFASSIPRDDALLADANALAISALVRGAAVLGVPAYASAARKAAEVLDSKLRNGDRILHCMWPDGRRCSAGYLPDQALVALAYLDLADADPEGARRWTDSARALADGLVTHFGHDAGGGFFLTAADAEPLQLRYKPSSDSVTPSGNAAAARLFTRLAARESGADPAAARRHAAIARKTLEAFAEVLSLRPLAAPSLVAAYAEWNRLPLQVREAGDSSAPPQLDPAPAVHP